MKRTALKRKTPLGKTCIIGRAKKIGPNLTETIQRQIKKSEKNRAKKKAKDLLWSMSKADSEFSKWIRARDRVCARCGTDKNLTNSHFWPRQHKSVRYDPLNCIALCWMPCHKYHWEKEKQGAYRDFMIQWLGEYEYKKLEYRAGTPMPLKVAVMECMKLLGAL